MYRYHILSLLFVIAMVSACKQKDTIQENELFGKWNIVKAERNGKVTPYLRGGYFVINPDGRITVNITGDDETGTYTLKDKLIRMNNAKEFTLSDLEADSMTLQYRASPESDFVFYMARQHDTIQ